MKNITTIERIAMQKTAIKKTAMEKTAIAKITAKITTTALLFFLALFTLTTNLKAQAVQDNSKSGFFAGFVVLDGFQVDSTKSVTTSETTSYRITGYSNTTTSIVASNDSFTDEVKNGIETFWKANCETGAASVDIPGDTEYYFNIENVTAGQFDEGKKPLKASVDSKEIPVTIIDPFVVNMCYNYFASRTPFTDYSVTADSGTPPQVSAESDKLSGVGLQFGYRGEKWRASFTHYTGQGGDNEFTNSLVMADYFFSGEFFVGAGIASMQLTNSSAGSSTSASATSPVLQVGYTENLTKNLQLSIGVLQYSSGLSLSHSSTTVNSLQETQTALGDSAIMGTLIYIGSVGTRSAIYDDGFSPSVDARTEVTQVGERTVNIEEIVTPAGGGTIEAEIKAPTVISISLQLSF